LCSWCYDNPPGNAFDISYIQRIVASTFERLLSTQQSLSDQEEIATSKLSKTVIELLELLVNVEPSPNFLRLHAKETLMIKQAKESPSASQRNSVEKLLDKQYNTYKNHLKFLQNCIDYYQSILEVSDETSDKDPKVPKYR
jgi:inactivated superfamily I helicase